jgi:hypothetical protein
VLVGQVGVGAEVEAGAGEFYLLIVVVEAALDWDGLHAEDGGDVLEGPDPG